MSDGASTPPLAGTRYFIQPTHSDWMDWIGFAKRILKAHAAQVRKDNPVTDRCPECGGQSMFVNDGRWDRDYRKAHFCPDCGLPLTEDAT